VLEGRCLQRQVRFLHALPLGQWTEGNQEFEQKETKLTKVRDLLFGTAVLQDTVTPGRNLKNGFAEGTPLFPLFPSVQILFFASFCESACLLVAAWPRC
jgi:hypothetical protein